MKNIYEDNYENNYDSSYQELDWLKRKAAFERKKFEIEQCYGVDYNSYIAANENEKDTPINYKRYPAKPTRYNGQYFRSKLEATWAAFFDRVVEQWEYEPEDAKSMFFGWRPDFKIWVHQTPVYCEVKPLLLSSFPHWLSNKIVDSETAKHGSKNKNTKLAILGNVVPLTIGGISSLGYISLKKRNNQRDWLPFSVKNSAAIAQIWKDAEEAVQSKSGLTHVSDCLRDLYALPVENLFKKTGS